MATKTITTRIKNRFDELTNWQKTGVELLPGEIALVKVTTQTLDANGNIVDVPAVLMKVGESDGKGGSKAFSALPWLSAKAADVYEWAKEQYAKDIPVTVLVGETQTSDTLGSWLKEINDRSVANAANYTSLSAKVDVASVSGAIDTAIKALDSTTSGSGNFVKAVAQTDGKVTVTYGNITANDIPTLAASKISVTSETNLADKLVSIDSDIADLKEKQAGHTDAQINTLIDNKVGNLDSTVNGTGDYVTSVTQTDGKVTVTKGNLPIGVAGGIAGYDAVFGTDGISSKVNKNASDIADLAEDLDELTKTVSKGVNFRGEVASAPSGTTYTLKSESTAKAAIIGDIVICGEKEYIYTAASTWKELGDLSRVGTLETWRNKLVKEDAAVTSQFVTEVDIASDGTVTINRAQPTSGDVKHGTNSTVSAELTDHANKLTGLSGSTVQASIDAAKKTVTDKIDALDLTADPTSSGEAADTQNFVTQVRQADGQVSYTRHTLPVSSTSKKGIVQLSDATNSTSTTLAATANAVNQAYSKANTAAQGVTNIEANYVKFANDKLYVGKDGADEIIFDCGGAVLS